MKSNQSSDIDTKEKPLSSWSKVSQKKTRDLTPYYWLSGGVLAVFLVFMLSTSQAKLETKQGKTNWHSDSDYSASLHANLAQLKALREEKKPSAFVSETKQNAVMTDSPSKQYLARQNAPTTMYEGVVNKKMPSGIHSNTFLEPEATPGSAHLRTPVNLTVESSAIAHPGFTVVAGEFLHAVLETAINSDLPGGVRAVVSQPAYSYTGERTLIPAGSRLIGHYASATFHGQQRIMVIWARILLPNGVTITLDSPGTDTLGRTGQRADSINTHFFARFGSAALLSLISAGTATVGVGNQTQYNSGAQYRMAIAQSFQQSSQQSLQKSLPRQATLRRYQGARINVFVARDLNFYRTYNNRAKIMSSQPLVRQ